MSKDLYIFFLVGLVSRGDALLFSKMATNLGIIGSVSVPVTDIAKDQRLIVDWCFQMGYDLPGTLSPFYNIPVWPTKIKSKRHIQEIDKDSSDSIPQFLQKYHHNNHNNQTRHMYDFTAGELYQAVEYQLQSYNIEKSCLLQAVCSLAKHPFDDSHKNLFTDLLTFFLSPSMHRGFHYSEKYYKQKYEAAELAGLVKRNCSLIYSDCRHDLLQYLSFVI